MLTSLGAITLNATEAVLPSGRVGMTDEVPGEESAVRIVVVPFVDDKDPPPVTDQAAVFPDKSVRPTSSHTPNVVRDRSDGVVATVTLIISSFLQFPVCGYGGQLHPHPELSKPTPESVLIT